VLVAEEQHAVIGQRMFHAAHDIRSRVGQIDIKNFGDACRGDGLNQQLGRQG